MDYLAKQLAFLSEAFKTYIDKLAAAVALPALVLESWQTLRAMLDTHLYESLAIYSFCHDINLVDLQTADSKHRAGNDFGRTEVLRTQPVRQLLQHQLPRARQGLDEPMRSLLEAVHASIRRMEGEGDRERRGVRSRAGSYEPPQRRLSREQHDPRYR